MKQAMIIALITAALLTGVMVHGLAAAQKDPKSFFEETCSQCHSIDIPKGEKLSKADWQYTVSRMRSNGMSISDEEASIIVNYLSTTYTVKR